MEESEIEKICTGDNLETVKEILHKFVIENDNVFSFPNLNENNRRAILWTALFQHLQNNASVTVHALCLASVRILSRDKTDLENLICEKWILTLVERAGLYDLVTINEESMSPITMPERQVAVEALKCLCNVAYNSEVARALCAHTSVAEGLVARLRIYKEIPYKDDVILYDMKLLFILTALRQDVKAKIKEELHGMDYLISCLNELLLEASTEMDTEGASGSSGPKESNADECYLNEHQQAIACQILKIQFNLIMRPGSDEEVTPEEDAMFLKLMPLLTALLNARTTTLEKAMELRSDLANLLISVPAPYYQYLTPAVEGVGAAEGPAPLVYDGHSVSAVHSLLELLQHRLSLTTTESEYESLCPVLSALDAMARASRVQRKFLRARVLPPLRDASARPERGAALRNRLCRLLTAPHAALRDLVADFLFVLCKEKVGRMVKYTGFGNAAGLLAQRGLLGGGAAAGAGGGGRGAYSSSSEDSDTEEYRRAAPHVDPVVGCTRPPAPDPFHGMTDEQKEYEAMKLVNLFDKMVSTGCVKPARVGPDGRPQALQHVMELRDQPPNRPQS